MADKKNMVQVEPKTRYKAYEIDMQRMIGKFSISNTRNEEVLEIKEKDVFEYDNVEVLLERAKRKSRQVYFLC